MSSLPSYLCAVATFLAAFTALFKEELSNFFFGPKIKTNISNLNWQENLVADKDDDNGAVQKAINYTLDLKVFNEGKKICKECEFFLTKIEYKDSEGSTYKELVPKLPNKPLWISCEKMTKIDIFPYSGNCEVRLATIGSPSSRKAKKGSSSEQKPELIIGSIYLEEDKIEKGFYKLSYSMFSSNCKRKNFYVEIKWNAKWANRKTEMELSIEGGE